MDEMPELTLNYGMGNWNSLEIWSYRNVINDPICRINNDGSILTACMLEIDDSDTLIATQKRDHDGNLMWEDEFLLSDYDPEGDTDYYRWNRLSDIMEDSYGRIIVSGEIVKKWGSDNFNFGIMMVYDFNTTPIKFTVKDLNGVFDELRFSSSITQWGNSIPMFDNGTNGDDNAETVYGL